MGSQIQTGTNNLTVESVLEKALVNCGLISEFNKNDFKKSGWSRASRTDRGVHAVCNGISVNCDIRRHMIKGELDQDQFDNAKKEDLKEKLDKNAVIDLINTIILNCI